MNIYFFIIWAVISYLIGSIPFGLVYSKLRGVDIRKVGSGNIGATNVSRQFGFIGGFVPVFILDVMKGALPVLAVRLLGVEGINIDIAMIIIGLICIFGNMFSVYLGFKGGKGVTTSAGIFLIIAPLELFACLPVFLIVLFAYRAVSFFNSRENETAFFKNLQKGVGLSSMSAVIFLPLSVYLIEPARIVLFVISFFVTIIILISHRSNIVNIIKGKNK